MSSSFSSSSSFLALRPTEIVEFLVGKLEVQRFPMKGGRFESRSRRSLYFNSGFFFFCCCSKWRLRKTSISLTDKKRASSDMREHTFMTF